MKSSTRLDSAIFHLTPTRTRCDLIITANEKKEKIASGLLNPFLTHLKTAQDQIAKGGYSILLEPGAGTDTTWFTKGTVERFVRFVSTPEILERVYTIESEILQIEEAIAIQGNNDFGLSTVENQQAKPRGRGEGSKPLLDASEENAIVLYKPGTHPPEANGSVTQEGNSKVQLLKVLEARKAMLQKEQGMAFARAVAAGFDIDHMAPLVSFAECFGASRLMDACLRFINLWKGKHESGQWLEIEAAEASRSDFSTMNASGIMISSMTNKHNESPKELPLENTAKAGIDTSADVRPPMDHQFPVGQQEYLQGQFPHPMFAPWPVHSPPGSLPVYQAYPMQGMPYYQNYPGNGPFYPSPYPPVEDSRFNVDHRTGQKRHSLDSRDSNTESEKWEIDASKTRSQDNLELEKEVSQSGKPRKAAGRSEKTQPSMVVIRNINYITSKRQNSSGSESESASESETNKESGELGADAPDMMHKNSLRSARGKGSHVKSIDELNSFEKEETSYEKETDSGHWEAFQNFLLRDTDEDKRAANQGMFAMAKDVQMKRRQNTVGDDPFALGGRDPVEVQEERITEFHKVSRNVTRMLRVSNDEVLISRGEYYGDGRGSTDDVQFREINGRKGLYRRTENDDFMIEGRGNQSDFAISSDPTAVNGFEHATNNWDRSLSLDMTDESFIVPVRAMSLDQVGTDDRAAVDMDSEPPSMLQNPGTKFNRIGRQVNYEPDDLSLMPEHRTEKMSFGYDPSLDYETQVVSRDIASVDSINKEVVTYVKQGMKKSEKDRRSKAIPDASDKKKIVGPIRKGKQSKMSPLDDARARAERLRTFKADLQKMKKEKEEEDRKRLEALKKERQKRIAVRGSSTSAQSPLPSLQTRKQMPTKVSPSSHKGSKFSDSEPGVSSPLQRSKLRATPLGSSDSQKASKASKLSNGSRLMGNRLSRSVSSPSEPKKESSEVTPDSKISMARIRRLSEPKTIGSHHATSVKKRSAEPVSKPKLSDGPESNKISAIMKLDRIKAATLPELKIRTSKGALDVGQNKSVSKETTQRVNGTKSSVTFETTGLSRKNDKISHHNDVDDNPVVEKTVVMLEREKPSIPVVHALEEKMGVRKGHFDNHDTGEKIEMVSEYSGIHAPASPMDGVDTESIQSQLQERPSFFEVKTGYAEKESPKFSSINTTENPNQAPYACLSSLDDPCTENSEYSKMPATSSDVVTIGVETAKTHVYNFKNMKLEKIPKALEKPQVKELSKGFRRLLKFGRKNHSSAAGDRHAEFDNASVNGSVADDNTSNTSSSEVYTLKNLISQDETPTAVTATQKTSRHFSLLSPFRNKTSEKKPTI